MKQHRVVFLPSNTVTSADDGCTLLSCARQAGEDIETICGEKASCGKCVVRIIEGENRKHNVISTMAHLSGATDQEKQHTQKHQLAPDERLACQAQIRGDLVIFIPEKSRTHRLVVRKETGKKEIKADPTIRKYQVKLTPPDMTDATADWERLRRHLETQHNLINPAIDYQVLKSLPALLRKNNWEITVTLWNDKEVIRIEPGDRKSAYGLAVDIGTTSVAGYLCDLLTGEVTATEAMMNPQVKYGEDVISRIAYTDNHTDGLGKLNQEIILALNKLANNLTTRNQLLPEDITEVVLAGNTAMHHILLGLDVHTLGRVPFSPCISRSVDIKARELGLDVLPSANVHVLPLEAGFVGADNVAVLIAEQPYLQDDMLLIIDIGTNGELVLGNREKLLCASCATGPALEGASIKFGTRAARDTIDKVRIDPETFEVRFSVIGKPEWHTQRPPEEIGARGLCGSGILDAVAEMFTAGIIQKNGSMNNAPESPRMRRDADNMPEFVIAWAKETAIGRDITVTQKDVRAIQLAKAAIYAGSQILLRHLGIDRPDKVILAGAFGSVLDKKRALVLGMFPDCGIKNVLSVGNAAGDGARFALVNKAKRAEAERIARQVYYIELTNEPDFQDTFISATHFPHM